MHNFDEKRKERELRDRSFTIGGEAFVYRAAVAPEAVVEWGKLTAGEYYARDVDGGILINPVSMKPISTLTEEETLAIFDATVLAFLEPGHEEKWRRVRSIDAKHPLNLDDLTDVIQWLWEQTTAHPTGEGSASSDGSPSPPTPPNLKDVSSSAAAEG